MRHRHLAIISLAFATILVSSIKASADPDMPCAHYTVRVTGELTNQNKRLNPDHLMDREGDVERLRASSDALAEAPLNADRDGNVVFVRFRQVNAAWWTVDGYVGDSLSDPATHSVKAVGMTALQFDDDGRIVLGQEFAAAPVSLSRNEKARLTFEIASIAYATSATPLKIQISRSEAKPEECNDGEVIDRDFEATGGLVTPETLGIKDHPNGFLNSLPSE